MAEDKYATFNLCAAIGHFGHELCGLGRSRVSARFFEPDQYRYNDTVNAIGRRSQLSGQKDCLPVASVKVIALTQGENGGAARRFREEGGDS